MQPIDTDPDQLVRLTNGLEPASLPPIPTLPGDTTQYALPISWEEFGRRQRRVYEHPVFKTFRSAIDLFGLCRHPDDHTKFAPLIVCGSGPSLAADYDYIKSIKAGGFVVALNQAHDALVENGIIPDLCVMMETRDRCAEYVTPRDDVNYLLASSLADVTLKKFSHIPNNVFLWHRCDAEAGRISVRALNLLHKKNIPGISGGSTVGLQIIDIGLVFFIARDFLLFGYDSSGSGHLLNIKPKSGVTEMNARAQVSVDGRVYNKTYGTTLAMRRQAAEFWAYLEARTKSVERGNLMPFRVKFFGRGLLPDWAALMGYHADNEGVKKDVEKEGWRDEGRVPFPTVRDETYQESLVRRANERRPVPEKNVLDLRDTADDPFGMGELQKDIDAKLAGGG